MAKAQHYSTEQIEAARKMFHGLPVKKAGKTRAEVAAFLVNDIKRAMRQGYTLRDIRELLTNAGVAIPLTKLEALFGKAAKPEPARNREGAEINTSAAVTGQTEGADKHAEEVKI